MNQADASVGEAIIVAAANVDLVQDAARDLEDFIEEAVTPGHWPSWFYRLPDGLNPALGRGLSDARCPRTKRRHRTSAEGAPLQVEVRVPWSPAPPTNRNAREPSWR